MITLVSYVTLGFIAALGASIIFLIWTGKIDLSRVISEPNGDASMSRLQLLIFTFVVATSLFMLVAADGAKFPEVPQGVLLLLGISSSSYLVSKGIQFSASEGVEDRPPVVTVSPASARTSVNGPGVQFKATVIRSSNQEIDWRIDAPAYGAVDKNGLYTPPANAPDGVALPVHVLVRATSASDAGASATGTVTLA